MLKRISKLLLIAFVFVYVGIGLLLYTFQEKLLYHPTPNIPIAYSKVVLEREGAKIVVHVLNPNKSNAILYFGGNAESMAKSADYIAKQFPEFTCYLMDYRGFGESTGKPSQAALFSDALALYDKVAPTHQRISIGGRSLGTGVAVYVAAHREVSKLALITPYDSIAAVAQERYPLYPAALLLKDKYDSVRCVCNIKAKTFIVMAQNDKVIPRGHTQKLIEAFPKGQLKIAIIKNRGHIDISDDERYYKIMQDFIGKG